jgi:hypothetical protein
MSTEFNHAVVTNTRRDFLRQTIAGAVAPLAMRVVAEAGESGTSQATAASATFQPDGDAYQFDTGILRGTLRNAGKSQGLFPVVHCATGKSLARGLGLFSHYRLLDDSARYGSAGWDWASKAERLDDASVAVAWSPDDEHPFEMRAVYRLSAPDTLDLTTKIIPTKELKRFEVFLASYFDGFPQVSVYVKPRSQAEAAGFLEARKEDALWHMFPRDAAAVEMIQSERWQRPPNPVEWTIRPELAGPLALRRDRESGLCALIMARPEQCFAVAMPYGDEAHRSVYLSLFGQDLRSGEPALARTRLVIRAGVSDDDALTMYQEFLRQTGD